jgi:arsenate reductase
VEPALPRRLLGELVGTAFLLFVVVGSGIAAQRLSTDPGLVLFAHAAAVGAGLSAMILAVGPVSRAHLNPAVTLSDWLLKGLSGRDALAYVGVQIGGGVLGVVAAHASFGLPAAVVGGAERLGGGLWLSEAVGTLGLVVVIFAVVRSGRVGAVGGAVGAYVAAVVFATSSTGFVNPAVTLARVLTDTYTGIAPASAAGFLVAQVAGALVAVALVCGLYPGKVQGGEEVTEPERSNQGRQGLRQQKHPAARSRREGT